MNAYEAAVYGLIQGLSEFLPISSSGHLALLPYVMKIDDPGVVFDLMMHFGTGLAVMSYFWRDIFRYIQTFTPTLVDFTQGGEDRWFVRNFIYATFVSVLAIVMLMPAAKLARDPKFIMVNLCVFGAILWLCDVLNKNKAQHLEDPMCRRMQWKLAGLIGLCQALAIFPGVSRSGITLSIALFLGMRRKEAGAFSFLLSLPIIMAGILKEVPDLLKEQNTDSVVALGTGVLTSFVVGYLTIHFFMKLIARIQLGYFAVYRGLVALAMYFVIF
jgi:undecaprenyl-diphosphatase